MRSIRLFSAIIFSAMVSAIPVFAAAFPGPAPLEFQAGPQEDSAQKTSAASTAPTKSGAASADPSVARASFDGLADSALLAMRKRADELKVKGVAVVAYFDGEKVESWSSKMEVVGRLKDEPSGQKGSNLLAVAYAKAAEMADTLKNSGSQVRPPMTGEFGWEGGVIVRAKTGYLIAAFSGGEGVQDVAVSRAGVAQILDQLKASH